MRWTILMVGCVCAAGACTPTRDDVPPPTHPPSAAPPTAVFEVRVPAAFERDAADSERVALRAVYGETNKGLCKALVARDAQKAKAAFAPGFSGRAAAAQPDDAAPVGRLSVTTYPVDPAPVDADAFVARALAWVQDLARVDACKIKPYRFKLAADHTWAWAELSVHVDGVTDDGRRITRRTKWLAEYARQGEGDDARYLLRRAESKPVQQVAAPQGAFTDVSRWVGVTEPHDETTRATLASERDGGSIETIGGLAVVDWNDDGFDDLLAWNRLRFFSLFQNDGKGGFEARHDLLPLEAVGTVQAIVDLDGDGSEEVVSGRVTACVEGDQGSFPVFTRKGDALVPVATLPVTIPCGGHGGMQYQTIVAHDVDGDGDLDLFVGGYGTETPRGDFNKFDSTDGQANLLYINQGGLRFTEEAAARGLDGTRFTYAATFTDLDGDGRDDLFVVNDYGPNEVFIGRPGGRFQRALLPPLTGYGQSMGVTVADLDDDGALDIYVSNMQSSAGNRIVPLFEGQLRPETYEGLMRMAAGNTLFRRRADGTYEEAAGPLGLAGANWAWGQAIVDLDNDGHREVYVLNGETSHSTEKENDF
ncbi:MAG: VCBS repeat-containing protein [Myxococcales bacterium]|nr:VCBS repeat-containing protein [Myxococcales bacterium]